MDSIPANPLIPPWQDPEQEELWRARPEDQHMTVKLTQAATEVIWNMYRLGIRHGFVPITFGGEIFGNGAALDYEEAVVLARSGPLLMYSLHRRRAWRLVWHHPRIEQRERHNAAHEAVELLGYKGLSDQWKDRPRAKLFANDF